ncbi:MAG: hypothetical protein AAGI07_17210 [Bacteroidota bacterium]
MKVYRCKAVKEIESFYGELLYRIDLFQHISEHLNELVETMWEGLQNGVPVLLEEISNYHPSHLGKSNIELAKAAFTKVDCKLTIANEYSFSDWEMIEALGKTKYNLYFENAINTLLKGDLLALKMQLSKYPDIVTCRSQYGHHATLLHYIASNGVEMWRQKVPYNLPEITKFLLILGANPAAKMKIYGEECDVKSLLSSSAHPFDAGIGEELLQLLESNSP